MYSALSALFTLSKYLDIPLKQKDKGVFGIDYLRLDRLVILAFIILMVDLSVENTE